MPYIIEYSCPYNECDCSVKLFPAWIIAVTMFRIVVVIVVAAAVDDAGIDWRRIIGGVTNVVLIWRSCLG